MVSEWLPGFLLELVLVLAWLTLLAAWLVWLSRSASAQLTELESESLKRLAQERESLMEMESELARVPRSRLGLAVALALGLVLSWGLVWGLGSTLPLQVGLALMLLWALGLVWSLVRVLGKTPEKTEVPRTESKWLKSHYLREP
tara:strand:+ start:556 stop:990 length:435 start_codon:yes stop_codon:yes gene_type:complete